MHRQDFFGSFRSPSDVKYYLNSQTPAILKHGGKIKVCNNDVNCASVLLYIYFYQNALHYKTKHTTNLKLKTILTILQTLAKK